MAPKRLQECRWTQIYGEQNRMREIIAPAYTKGVAPFVAGVIAAHNAPKTRVLVIGGGNGAFSRRLLPKVEQILERHGVSTQIDVIETDISGVVRHAPGKRVVADAHNLPFKNRSFDVVIGESMLHQANNVPRTTEEVSRVLSPLGFFIHVQDAIPDPRDYVSREQMIAAGIPPGASEIRLADINPRAYGAIVKAAHIGLLQKAHVSAKNNGMGFMAIGVQTAEVTPNRLTGEIAGIPLTGINHVRFAMNGASFNTDATLPAGTILSEYQGMVSIASKRRPLGLIKQKINEMSDGQISIDP